MARRSQCVRTSWSLSTGIFLLMAAFMVPVWALENELRFQVYLGDDRVGSHRVSIEEREGRRDVIVEASMDVQFLFFTAFTYRHRAEERWQGDCLVSLRTETNDDGTQLRVVGIPDAGALEVVASEQRYRVEGCVRTFAYWDPQLLRAERLLNTQTGEYEPVTLEQVGDRPLEFLGASYGERQYRLRVDDDVVIDLWYARDGRWLALETEVSGGNILRYIREDLDQ